MHAFAVNDRSSLRYAACRALAVLHGTSVWVGDGFCSYSYPPNVQRDANELVRTWVKRKAHNSESCELWLFRSVFAVKQLIQVRKGTPPDVLKELQELGWPAKIIVRFKPFEEDYKLQVSEGKKRIRIS